MESPRILIVRLSAIGDAIQTMPVACALRERFPQAFLAWAVESRAAALLHGHEAIDELILLPRGWLKSPGGVWRLRRKLHALRFDVAIDVQSLTKSAVLAWLSGARRRIGFGNPGGRELSKWFNNERVDPKSTHVVDRYLELLRPLGIESPTVRFQVPEREDDAKTADEIIRQRKLEDGFAIINPGAGWPSKLWPTERYAAVARHLAERWQLPTLVVWAGAAERAMAEQIAGASAALDRPADDVDRIGRAGPACEAVHRRRHGPAAPGGGGRHAVRGPLRSLAGVAARSLRSAAHRLAEDVLRGIEPGASHRPARLHGEHHDRDGVRGVRSDIGTASRECKRRMQTEEEIAGANSPRNVRSTALTAAHETQACSIRRNDALEHSTSAELLAPDCCFSAV